MKQNPAQIPRTAFAPHVRHATTHSMKHRLAPHRPTAAAQTVLLPARKTPLRMSNARSPQTGLADTAQTVRQISTRRLRAHRPQTVYVRRVARARQAITRQVRARIRPTVYARHAAVYAQRTGLKQRIAQTRRIGPAARALIARQVFRTKQECAITSLIAFVRRVRRPLALQSRGSRELAH